MNVPTRAPTPTVYIVDDDLSVREALEGIITHHKWRALTFASAQAFLDYPRRAVPSCLVLDVGLPDLDGLELQKRLPGGNDLPVIFITARGDIPMSVSAMKAGAVEFLTKPFEPQVLLGAVRSALERSRLALVANANLKSIRARYNSLSRREQEVMGHVVMGLMNKQVAAALGVAEITVKGHRGKMMQKMNAKSVAELVTIADLLGLDIAGRK